MRNSSRRFGFLLALALLAPLAAQGQTPAPFCHVSATRAARTFYLGERVVLSLSATGALRSGQYTVTDYYGRITATGGFQVGGGVPQSLPLGRGYLFGIYYLHLTTSAGEQQDDAFCVIPRPDANRGEYGAFSFHYQDDKPDVWAALAQVGCRVIRHDIAWPAIEAQKDQYDFSYARRVIALAQQYGMQLIPILGYTPTWAGMEPLDATGRVATAWHTWAAGTTTGWPPAMRELITLLSQQRVTWPASAAIRPSAVSGQGTQPLVHSWEIWNEVDQNFYYVYWGRYLDMLRLVNLEIKAQDPWGTVLYGGSCGHWTQLGMTYTAGAQYYFDRLAFHPSGTDLDKLLAIYFTGAPQIGNGYGLYHTATMTESYPYCPPGVTDAQFMPRMYALLRKWQLDTFCWFGGAPDNSNLPGGGSMCHRVNGDLVPNAKYVALAVARWQLCAAKYVGPLDLGAGVQAQLMLRHGRPVLVAWADAPTTVNLRVYAGARTSDEMGRETLLRATDGVAPVALSPAAVVILGLMPDYLGEAFHSQAELYLTTPQGFTTDQTFGYIRALEVDAAPGWAGWAAQFRADVDQATGLMHTNPHQAMTALSTAQMDLNTQIMNMLKGAQTQRQVSPRTQSVVWRLQAVSEWLGAVLDSYCQRWGNWVASPANYQQLQQDVETLRQQAAPADRGLTCPVAMQSLRRAHALLQLTTDGGLGIGLYRAARGECNAARLLMQIETPLLIPVVATADFVNARQLTKVMALVPGEPQELRVYVYNYTTQPVSGTLVWQVPESWQIPAESLTAPFTAPPGGQSEAALVHFTIPAPPAPWPTQIVRTPAGGDLNLQVPAGLEAGVSLTLGGTLDDGRRLLPVAYPMLIGEPMLTTP